MHCVIVITIALGFNGASTVVNLSNALDLAPNYAPTLYSIINTFATLAGVIAPMVVTYFTREHVSLIKTNGMIHWKWKRKFFDFLCAISRIRSTSGMKYFWYHQRCTSHQPYYSCSLAAVRCKTGMTTPTKSKETPGENFVNRMKATFRQLKLAALNCSHIYLKYKMFIAIMNGVAVLFDEKCHISWLNSSSGD